MILFKNIPDWRHQFNALKPVFLKVYLFVFGFVAIVWLIAKAAGIETSYLVADPAEITQQAFYIGFFSVMGSALWCVAAATCFFSVFLLHHSSSRNAKWQSCIFISGLISTILFLDDTFQLHEQVYDLTYWFDPHYNQENWQVRDIFEMLTFAFYGIAFFAYLFHFRSFLKNSDYLFLFSSFMFFGLSTLVDLTHQFGFLEESLKLVGIVSWVVYFFRFCRQAIYSAFAA